MNAERRILVTGGAGYIGSHACKALALAGFTPVSDDNLVYGHRWAVRWGPLEEGDIGDHARLDAVIARDRPTAVMHFAAYTDVGESVLDPGKYYRNNVAGTLTLLEAMRDHGIGQFVFSSTCATYGEPQRVPIDEGHAQRPINPYGASKLMIERMLADFAAAHGLRWIALRDFNAAGADPDGEIGEIGEIGERHDPETHLIPLVLDAAAGARPAITVYGDDDTPDGTYIRDYIHVSDLADGHVLALRSLQAGGAGAAYNLGIGMDSARQPECLRMKTDISIYDFLALGPEAFRILAGGREFQGPYDFRSETIKNIERRIDGLCDPIEHDGPVWIIEFQVERNQAALYNLLTKLGLYGEQHPHRDVRGLLIVPREPNRPAQPQGRGRNGDLIAVVYLEDWLRTLFQREPDNPFLAALAPLIFTDTELTAQAPALWRTITDD